MSYTRAVLRGALALGLLLPALALQAQAASTPPPLALVPTVTSDIDPIVGRFVDRALANAGAARGYAVIDAERVSAALAQLGAAQPLRPDELQRLATALSAPCAATATASASAGAYLVKVTVACTAGAGPYFAQGQAGATDLESVTARLLASALPPAVPSVPAPPSAPTPPPAPASTLAPAHALPPPADEPDSLPGAPRFRLALHEALAFGLADDPFFGNVIGARADFRIADQTWLGVHLGYANLPARSGRANNLLPYAQFEQRIPLSEGSAFAIPLRVAIGYLPHNGGYLRASSGLAIPLGERTELVFDLLAPSFLQTPDKTLLALDLGTEIGLRL